MSPRLRTSYRIHCDEDFQMIRLGLIGSNIRHSLSADIHNHALEVFEFPGGYESFDLEEKDLEDFLNFAWEEGFLGLNITAPYKEHVAKLVGAKFSSVNTLYRGSTTWLSKSTDGPGLFQALEKLSPERSVFERLVILGSGGVLEPILEVLGDVEEVYVLRRSKKEVLSQHCPHLQLCDWDLPTLERLLKGGERETLCIQASSAPLNGDDLSSFVPAMEAFSGSFVDLVYGKPSQLFHEAWKKKIPCQDGLPMLIEQARLCQEIWFGKSLSFEELWNFLKASPSPC